MKKLLLPILFLVATGSSAQKVSSKLLFQKGQKIEVTSNTNSTVEMMMGESSSSSVGTEIYEVKDATGTSATIERSMKKIKLNLSIMGQERTVDSDKPEDLKSMLGEPIKELLKMKNEFTVDAGGKVISVKSNGEKMKDENPMMSMFMQQWSMSTALPKEGQPSFFKILPDYEVGKGDTWIDSVADVAGTVKTSFSVKDITDSEVLLDFTSDGIIDTKQNMMGMNVEVKGTIKSTGTITLDKATGIIKQKTATTNTESASNLNGQELNTTTKATTVLTVKIL